MTRTEKVLAICEILKKRFNNLSAMELVRLSNEIMDTIENLELVENNQK